jgi:hypothetical protein
MEERYDLTESRRSVRELYPVLLDAHGNVIDGYHRLRADPEWRTETLEHIRTPTQLVLARIIANTHRRSVSREEREEQINELAKCLQENENVPGEGLISTIADLTTFSDDYVRRLLSDDYKLRPGVGGGAHASVGLSPTQREEFDETLRNIGIVVPRGTPGPPGLDAISEGEAPEPGPEPEEQAAAMALSEDEAPAQPSALDYAREHFRRYLKPDEDFLAWDLCRKYGVSDREARRIIADVKAEKTSTPEPRRTQLVHHEPQAPTCRCPLCGRDGADKLLILANFVEDTIMAQMTLFDFVTEAFKQ